MIRPSGRRCAIVMMLPVSVCFWLSPGTTALATTSSATPTPTPPASTATPTYTRTCVSYQFHVPGCCDFSDTQPQRSCFNLVDGPMGGVCVLEGGQPRGCPEAVTCNAAGRCEFEATPTPTPTGAIIGIGDFCEPDRICPPPLLCLIDPPHQARVCACVGDCDGNAEVTVDELLAMVNVALGNTAVSACSLGDANSDGQIDISEILQAVNNTLLGCSSAGPPTATPTPTPIAGCGDICDGRFCRLPDDSTGTCLVGPGGVCHCAPEVTPVSPTPTLPQCIQATPRPDIPCPDEGLPCGACSDNPCRMFGRDGRCDCDFSQKCTCDTEGPTATATPLCQFYPTATPSPTPTLPQCVQATPRPDIPCDPTMCNFTSCILFGRNGVCHVFPNGGPATCACDTEGPTPSPTPLCQLCPTPSVSPSRCNPAYEPYTCAQDRNGCEICKCCNFEGVGGCCDFGGTQPCFILVEGQDWARCTYGLHGTVVSGCPLPVSCNPSSGRCEYPNQ
jgi:hypothetical protein